MFKKPVYVTAAKNNVIVECSFEWNAGYSEEVLPFTNNIPQKMGEHIYSALGLLLPE